MNLPHLAIKYRAVTIAATLLAMFWGIAAFMTAPRREDPEFKIRTCVVSTSWPGATAEKVEQLVTEPIEKAVDSLDEVDKVTSLTTPGLSTIFVDLEESIDEVDASWEKVRAKVDEATPDLPEGSSTPLVNTEFGDTSAMVLAVYQKPVPGRSEITRPYSPRQLEIIADRIKDELKLLEAVANVELYGVQQETIYLETDVGTWSQLELTTDTLKTLLEHRNIVAPGGTIDTDHARFGVKPTGELNAVRQLNRVIVGIGKQRTPAYLKDLGIKVSRRYQEPPTFVTRFGAPKVSAPCVVVSFTMKAGESITELGEAARAKLEELEASMLPRDIEVAIVADQAAAVSDCINDFLDNLWQAIVIVVGVAFFLIGLRIAIVMAAAIPLVILASFGICRFFGVQLEQVSIASLIIALGMLVDNAIEVADNAQRLLEEGYSRLRAAVEGSQQVAFPVLIATLTTVAAFLPMIALPGSEGEYIFSLPTVVSTTLMTSWFVAMTTTTLMAYWMLRPGEHSSSPLSAIVSAIGRVLRRGGSQGGPTLRDRYGALCAFCLRHRALTISLAVLVFVGACALVPLIGSQYFPPAFRSQFTIDVWLPEGSPFQRTNEVCRQVEGLIRELSYREFRGENVERLKSMVSYVGQGGPRFYLNLNPEQEASNYAQVVVNTYNAHVVDQYVKDIRSAADQRIAGARIVPRKLDMGPGVDAPIGIRLTGEDISTLKQLAEKLEDAMRGVDGTVDVHDAWGNFGYQLVVDVDEDKANLAGVSNAIIAQTLNAFFSGHYLTTYREGDHRVPIYLRLPPEQRTSIDQIKSIYVEGLYGKVPLDAVASVRTEWLPAKIWRRKLHRMIEVKSRVREGLLANAVLARAMPRIEEVQKQVPPGYRLEIGGEQEETIKSQSNQGKALGISLLLIILCLVVQYNSFAKPLVILLTLPMASTGAFVGLFVMGYPLGFMAMLGLLSLAGIVLNDAIVLIEFIETLVKEKLERGEGLAEAGHRSCSGLTREAFRDCVVHGGQMRLLPIWLTTLTTVGGLLPLGMSGGPLFAPMAWVIVFGLLFATALTLLIIPSIFSVFVENFGVAVVSDTEKEVDHAENQ